MRVRPNARQSYTPIFRVKMAFRFESVIRARLAMPRYRPLLGLIVFGVCMFGSDEVSTARAGFTGPNVPAFRTMNGDLDITGVTLANGHAETEARGNLRQLVDPSCPQAVDHHYEHSGNREGISARV